MFKSVLLFIVVVCLSGYLFFRKSRKRLYELAATFPGPFDLPLIGSAYVAFGRGPDEIYNYLFELVPKYTTPLRAWAGPLLFLVFTQPEHLSVILNSQDCVRRTYLYEFFNLGQGIFIAKPDVWRKLRKQLNPSFTIGAVKKFVPLLNRKSDDFVKRLDVFDGQKAFDVLHVAAEFTLTSTVATTLDYDLDKAGSIDIKRFLENAERMFSLMFTRVYKAWLHPQIIFKFTSNYREQVHRSEKFITVARKIIESRQERKRNNPTFALSAERDDDNIRNSEILIEKLERIASESNLLNDETMLDNINTFILASYDTTASTIAATLLMLAMHPDVQERAFQEINDTILSDDIDYEHLSKLVYLEMVLKETMRLVPVTPAIGRVCEKETKVGEHMVPKGAQIIIPIHILHRDKNVWGERADYFDPENFSPEKSDKRHPYAFLGFSGGIRNCIGMRYAYMVLKIAVAKMIMNYKFSTDIKYADIKFNASVVMRIANGYMISLERRKKETDN
ncbi:probable cytochrome P450 313a4 [Toxorhynchites rutilus septentrionalis]|uniref:probable cytochrome P450 313a4 n=1 Tax=Toxorhynchites rutilus septentrionalis TaxID=329112 RepID=UPI00247ACC94|nr:probable cytochrome P450 313a4 [Toxorhynchites rutilus septentrionalis]